MLAGYKSAILFLHNQKFENMLEKSFEGKKSKINPLVKINFKIIEQIL